MQGPPVSRRIRAAASIYLVEDMRQRATAAGRVSKAIPAEAAMAVATEAVGIISSEVCRFLIGLGVRG
jgi:hypothetical protein